MRRETFTRGMIVGGIIGASIGGMVSRTPQYRWRKNMVKAGRNFMRRNGIADLISDMF